MIPSGAPHIEMILGGEHGATLANDGAAKLTDAGLALV